MKIQGPFLPSLNQKMKKSTRKGLMICLCTTAITLVIIAVVFVSLFFTIFKPKDPILIPQPTKLQNVSIKVFPSISMNSTLNMTITVYNRNYGSFQFKNTDSSVYYRGTFVTAIPIEGSTVPARSSINITTSTNITAEKLVTNRYFVNDIETGQLNLSSTVDMDGKVSVLKIFKFGAKVFTHCEMIIYLKSYAVEGTCVAKLKL